MSDSVGYVNVASFILNLGGEDKKVDTNFFTEAELKGQGVPAERLQEFIGLMINKGDAEDSLAMNFLYEDPLRLVASFPSHNISIAPENVNYNEIIEQYAEAGSELGSTSDHILDEFDGVVTAEIAYSMLVEATGEKEPNTESLFYRFVEQVATPSLLAEEYPFVEKTIVIDGVKVPEKFVLDEGEGWKQQVNSDLKSGNGMLVSVRPNSVGGFETSVTLMIEGENKAPYAPLLAKDEGKGEPILLDALRGTTAQAGAFWTAHELSNPDIAHYEHGDFIQSGSGDSYIQVSHITPLNATNEQALFNALHDAFMPVISENGAEILREAAKEEREAFAAKTVVPDARENSNLQLD